MKKKIRFCMMNILVIALLASLVGCGSESSSLQNTADDTELAQDAESSQQDQDTEEAEESSSVVTELYVQFGSDGETFVLHLYDNDTAAAIANYVGTTTWQLPIYHYDDFEDWEVMQYYDIPSRYEIPDNAESITSEQGGTVYYSDPNRLVLFYQDAEVSGDYTLVGTFDYTEEFVTAVEENPVLEGWGNKIIIVSASE